VIATGSRPAVPLVPGLAKAGYLTSGTVFMRDELPGQPTVPGGGTVGWELAQAFAAQPAIAPNLSCGAAVTPDRCLSSRDRRRPSQRTSA